MIDSYCWDERDRFLTEKPFKFLLILVYAFFYLITIDIYHRRAQKYITLRWQAQS
jgi:hypothetical protein